MRKQKPEKKKETNSASTPENALNKASTCSTDRPLFRALALSPFTDIPTGADYFVGEVKFTNNVVVKIWVCPMPALFWKVEIFSTETNKTTHVSTGSGALENFWHAIRLIAEGMLVVESKE
jgi:hypothetical protein